MEVVVVCRNGGRAYHCMRATFKKLKELNAKNVRMYKKEHRISTMGVTMRFMGIHNAAPYFEDQKKELKHCGEHEWRRTFLDESERKPYRRVVINNGNESRDEKRAQSSGEIRGEEILHGEGIPESR